MSRYLEDIIQLSGDTEIREWLNGKTVAVIGASGMIGSAIVDDLMCMVSGHTADICVIAMGRHEEKLKKRFSRYLGNEKLILIEQDITEKFDPGDRKPDIIIHAASNTHPYEYSSDPIGTISTNVFGTSNILEWMKGKDPCRLVIISSVEIYGENRGDTEEFNEEYCGYLDCNTMRAGYPESKRLSETLAQAYISAYGLDITIIRLCRVYGPTLEKDDSKALTQFLRKGVNGEDIVLKSAGNQFYSYLYITDAVRALLKVAKCGKCGFAYNASSRESNIRLKDLAEMIAELSGRQVIYEKPSDKEKSGYSIATKALLDPGRINSLGWSAVYRIKDGIKRTLLDMKEMKNY